MSEGSMREGSTTRRSLLAAALGGAAAWLAGAVARVPSVDAGVDGDVVLGATNTAAGVTTVAFAASDAIVGRSGSPAHSGLWGDNTGAGYGVSGSTDSVAAAGVWGANAGAGVGVRGTAGAGGIGVRGFAADGTGVGGSSTNGVGVTGDSSATDGIVGASNALAHSGVWGHNTGGGYGVSGSTDGAGTAGVWGSNSGSGAGVRASSASGHALEVLGLVHLSRSVKATVGAGKKSVTVSLAGVTPSSMVFANLAKSVSGRAVAAAVAGSGAFTIYLNGTVASSTPVVWVVLDA
jgi:hypothetical protein